MGNHFELKKFIIKEEEESDRVRITLDSIAPATVNQTLVWVIPGDLKCSPVQRNLSSLDFLMDKDIYIFFLISASSD